MGGNLYKLLESLVVAEGLWTLFIIVVPKKELTLGEP